MIWNRNEFLAHMNFEDTGKEMFAELFGLLVGLDGEWRSQGASGDELSLRAFGWDSVKYASLPVRLGPVTGKKEQVIFENDEEKILIDELGRKCRLCKKSATIALPMNYPVKTMDDWIKLKPCYTFREDRVDTEALKLLKKRQDEGTLLIGSIPGGFDEPRQLMGEEGLCIAFYDEPELVADMLQTFADTAMKCYERVTDLLTVDWLSVHEDLAGKSGPLIGPAQIEEFIRPYYRTVWDYLSSNGCRVFSQDSDGNMNAVVDAFLDCGVNLMYPCEPGSGMDIVQLRKKYGNRLSFKGGINKYALRGSKEDIKKELEYKMCDITMHGGTVFALDHRIPNGVPIENYRYYVKLGREILNLPPANPCDMVRMAF